MVPILLAASRVTAGRLQVTVFERTDPNVHVRRRHGEGANAAKLCFVSDRLSMLIDVDEPPSDSTAPDARRTVVDVP
jgi:hypothetical protein